MIAQQPETSNTLPAPRFALSENVARNAMIRVLSEMGESMPVEAGSKGHHQAEAMRAAELVALQYTGPAKKEAKRKCLGHLIASLAPVAGGDA